MQRPICGSLALQKLDLVENFDLVENIAVTIFSTKSVVHCITNKKESLGVRVKKIRNLVHPVRTGAFRIIQ